MGYPRLFVKKVSSGSHGRCRRQRSPSPPRPPRPARPTPRTDPILDRTSASAVVTLPRPKKIRKHEAVPMPFFSPPSPSPPCARRFPAHKRAHARKKVPFAGTETNGLQTVDHTFTHPARTRPRFLGHSHRPLESVVTSPNLRTTHGHATCGARSVPPSPANTRSALFRAAPCARRKLASDDANPRLSQPLLRLRDALFPPLVDEGHNPHRWSSCPELPTKNDPHQNPTSSFPRNACSETINVSGTHRHSVTHSQYYTPLTAKRTQVPQTQGPSQRGEGCPPPPSGCGHHPDAQTAGPLSRGRVGSPAPDKGAGPHTANTRPPQL